MPSRRPTIHLITAFEDAAGGSEWRALNLYELLSPYADVRLWTQRGSDPRLTSRYPIRTIRTRRLQFPQGGTFVFIGVFFRPGRWLALTKPDRVVLMYNTPEPEKLRIRLREFNRPRWPTTEMIYTSSLMRAETGLPGRVELSLFSTDRFSPAAERPARPFTVGRLSRADPLKHHPDDGAIYRRLAAAGCEIVVMGAPEEMIDAVGNAAAITLLPCCAEAPETFLRGLDCFFYRTSPAWREPWARVVSEAMACGLPVVAERRGGYSEIIRHGVNGFLFDTDAEASELILALKDNPALRADIGGAARETQIALLDDIERCKIREFYIGSRQ